jgi:hypothetical protein
MTMFSKNRFRVAGILLVALALLLTGTVMALDWGKNGDLVRKHPYRAAGRHTLDQDYTQLRYVKTTDYGATWSALTIAGDLSTFAPNEGGMADFSAIVTNGNELCYVVYLPEAATPGVYSLTGPTFTPVSVMAEGTNDFAAGGRNNVGWTDVGKAPNGDLYAIIWGNDASGNNTLWGVKSTNSGTSWGTPAVLLTSPTITADDELDAHIADLNGSDYYYVVFETLETDGRLQNVLRIPAGGGAATVVSTGHYAPASENQPSYYTGNCKPIAYDPTADALYTVHRNAGATAVGINYASNHGQNFTYAEVTAAQRYPSSALNMPNATPWIFSNYGVPAAGAEHYAWYSYDQVGYNGGLWTDPTNYAHITYDGVRYLLYMNEGYWWDANRGVSSHNAWGAHTPEQLWTSTTADGGATWINFTRHFDYVIDQLNATTLNNCEIVGGTEGVAYVITCGANGITDETPSSYTQMTLLTAPTSLGPYVVKTYISDNVQVDTTDCWINWRKGDGGTEDYVQQDSAQYDNLTIFSGWYYFTIPATAPDGNPWAQGDSIYFYCDGRDLSGNYGSSDEQIIIAGVQWLGVNEPVRAVTDEFRLIGNYPNPFNPTTRIRFDLPADLRVSLKIYNTLGQEVAVLADGRMMARGEHQLSFDGSALSSGLYFYTLQAGSYSAVSKMVLMK